MEKGEKDMQARHTKWIWIGVFTVSFLAFSRQSNAQTCTTSADCPPDTTAIDYSCVTGHCEYAGIPGGCSTDADCNDNFTCTANDHCSLGAPGGPTCRFPKNDPAGNDVCVDDGFSCTNTVGCNPFNPNHQPLTGCVHSRDDGNCPDKDECTRNIGCNPESTDPLPEAGTGCLYSPIKGCCDEDADCQNLKNGIGCIEHFCNDKTNACDERVAENCGACCLAQEPTTAGIGVGPVCTILNEDKCVAFGNDASAYKGDGTTCETDPCVPPRLSVSEKGSILYYSGLEVGYSPAATTAGPGFALNKDTFITLVNDLNRDVCVEWHFINGDDPLAAIPGIDRAHPGWNSYDCVTCLTPHENVFMSLARADGSLGCQPFTGLDPGTPPGRPDPDGLPGDRIIRGYAIAFAVDLDGNPISWNHLSGHATVVDYRNRSAWEYNTYAFPCVADPVAGNPCGVDPTTLSMDGLEYALAWDRLLFDFYAVSSTAFSRLSPATPVTLNTELTLYPVSADLRPNTTNTGGPVITRADIVIWNENEDDRTGTSRCIDCWDQTLLSNYDAPNNFTIELLNTNKGYARINGVQADSCDAPGSCCCVRRCSNGNNICENDNWCGTPPNQGTCGLFGCFDPDCDQADIRRGTPDRDCSENAALLGLSDKILTFGGAAPRRTDAGMTLVGIGTQPAAIRRTVIQPTAPLKDDKRTPREGSR